MDAARTSIVDRVLDVSEAHPDHVAIDTGKRSITYGELVRRSGGLAAVLVGDPPGPIAVAVEEPIEFATATLGALASGRAVVPIGSDLAPAALRSLLGAVGAKTAIVRQDGPSGHLRELASRSHDPRRVRSVMLERPTGPSPTFAHVPTSGSTGVPKVVRFLEGAVLGALERPLGSADPGPDDVLGTFLSPASFSILGLLQGLVAGLTTVSVDPRATPMAVILRTLLARDVSYLRIVPSLLRRLVRGVPAGTTLPAVRVVHCSAEALLWTDVEAVRRVLGTHAIVQNRVGMTEAGQFTLREVPADEPIGSGAVPAGRIVPGWDVTIERESGVPAGPGEEGEVVLEAALHRIAPQAEEVGGGRWRLRTGDVARIDVDGELTLLGRRDRMLKISGVRVEPAAVEDAMRRTCGVADAALATIDLADGERRFVAFVVVAEGSEVPLTALRDAVAAAAPPAAMPARFVLRTEALPVLPSGKVDLARLLASLRPAGSEG